MQLKSIKAGKWYRTKQGDGKAVAVGGTHPPSVRMEIMRPFPRGIVYVSPRDVIEEIPDPTQQGG